MSDIPSDADLGGEGLVDGEIEDVEIGRSGEDEEVGEDGESPGSETDEEEGAGDEVDEPPATRGRQSQSARLRAERDQLRQELAEARGWQRATEQYQAQRPQQGPSAADLAEQQRREQEQLSMMSPQEVAAYYYQKGQQQFQQAMLMQSLQTEDRIDRQAYEIAASTSKFHHDHKAEVERRLVAERNAGNLRATRQSILSQIVGEQAMARGSQAASGQRRVAARRVASQQTRPTNGRGDGAAGGRRGKEGDPDHDYQLALEGMRRGIF